VIRDVGTDLCDIQRLALAVERTGERFLARVFTPAERAAAAASGRELPELARRFAVKESVFKVLGRGWPNGIGFAEIELDESTPGHGLVRLTGRAAQRAVTDGTGRLHAAATDDGRMAFAIVVAEPA